MERVCSRGLDENKARWFFQQLILALDYCHKMNISNRDIKLENTLLHSQGADRRPMVKLCDFGGGSSHQPHKNFVHPPASRLYLAFG